MAKHDDKQGRWHALTEEISAAETGLRPYFENTPALPPDALARIKAKVRSEAIGRVPARRPHHLLRIGAIAATIVLAAGLGLYFESGQSAPQDRLPVTTPGVSMQASLDADSLDAFTASLSKVLSDENPEVGELTQDLQDMESDYRSNG